MLRRPHSQVAAQAELVSTMIRLVFTGLLMFLKHREGSVTLLWLHVTLTVSMHCLTLKVTVARLSSAAPKADNH